MEVLRSGIENRGMSGIKLWVATYCDDAKVFHLVEKCKLPFYLYYSEGSEESIPMDE